MSAVDFLVEHGAARLAHPGGTLLAHLRRVAALLAAWGADEDVRLAGLCHAAYGTDGFAERLVDPVDRGPLRAVIGARAEELVHLYGSCVRAEVYPRIGEGGPIPFRDRFTGEVSTPSTADLAAFVLITVANEFDLFEHDPALAARHGRWLADLAERAGELLPAAVRRTVVERFAVPVEIAGLDHLVLTVSDVEAAVRFYRDVLGMRPVSVGNGRWALRFGQTKINLHQAGDEVAPHAAAPTRGSADLCLVSATPLDEVRAHIEGAGVAIELGPVARTGAIGPITSLYLRDPDGNLLEIAEY
jgi:catechol 2,3-dioxygenase-like lactoylglutathione lyase family enzyme